MSVIDTLSIAVFAGLSNKLKVDIPFDFMVNGKTLPAGQYTVEPSSDLKVLVIRSCDWERGAMTIAQTCEVGANSKRQLIFHRYGDRLRRAVA